jgi:hypothetical protein
MILQKNVSFQINKIRSRVPLSEQGFQSGTTFFQSVDSVDFFIQFASFLDNINAFAKLIVIRTVSLKYSNVSGSCIFARIALLKITLKKWIRIRIH